MKSLFYLIVLCVLFASIGQVASDIYLPSLPAITVGLHTTAHYAQLTVFLYMAGFSVSRLVYGPLSDALGRKMPLIFGLLFCLCGTLICALANSIVLLMFGRLLQGLGSGSGVVIAGAIVRDKAEDMNLAKLFSYLGISNVVMISTAPLLGGYLQHLFGWRASFIFIALYTLTALVVSIFFFAETNKHKNFKHLKPKQIKINLHSLFSTREFVMHSACIFLVYAAILAWLTLGPVLLEDTVGISPVAFGWVAMLAGFCYAAGGFLNAKMVAFYGMQRMLKIGAQIMLLSGVFMLFFFLLGMINFWVIVLPIFLGSFGSSFIFPNAYAGALSPFAKIAGIAGAVVGAVQVLGGALASGIISVLPDNNQLPIAIAYMFCGLLVWLLIGRLGAIHEKNI